MKIIIMYRCCDKIWNCPSSTKFNSTPLHTWTSIIFSMNIIDCFPYSVKAMENFFSALYFLFFMKLSVEIWKPINRIRILILIRANTIIAVRATGETIFNSCIQIQTNKMEQKKQKSIWKSFHIQHKQKSELAKQAPDVTLKYEYSWSNQFGWWVHLTSSGGKLRASWWGRSGRCR